MAGGGAVSNIRVGVVGGGAIAQVAHLPVLRKLKGVQVVGICDNDGPKASALAARFETGAAYGDIEELLELAKVDAVVICTPNHLHEAHAVAALAAGAHVLVERPLALSPTGAARVVKAAERYRRTLLVAMNHRFRADVQAVQGFLKGGELGALSTIRCGWHVFRQLQHSMGWRSRRAESGGGAMMDLGLPMLDLALWIAGNPAVERVSAFLDRASGGKQVDEAASAFVPVVVQDRRQARLFDVHDVVDRLGTAGRSFAGIGGAGAFRLGRLLVGHELGVIGLGPPAHHGREGNPAGSEIP